MFGKNCSRIEQRFRVGFSRPFESGASRTVSCRFPPENNNNFQLNGSESLLHVAFHVRLRDGVFAPTAGLDVRVREYCAGGHGGVDVFFIYLIGFFVYFFFFFNYATPPFAGGGSVRRFWEKRS